MKKLLALVLALVMTLGLATVGANAALSDFSDGSDTDAKYQEALGVMNMVGVFQGDTTTGTINPTKNLTRAEAAKLIAYLDLGETAAETLPAKQVFSDVPADNWAAKYVAYCAEQGIIQGADGKFLPNDGLSGYAFGAYLLAVLGYDRNYEGITGANWEIACAKLLDKTALGTSVAKAGSATLTRQEGAQYCFDALLTECVDYANNVKVTNADGSKVEVGNGAQFINAGAYITSALDAFEKDAGATDSLQLGEKLYKGNLGYTAIGTDDSNRPARQFSYKAEGQTTKYVTTAEQAEAAVTTRLSNAAAVTTALQNAGLQWATNNANVSVYLNGNDASLKDQASAADVQALTGNSVKVEFYDTMQNSDGDTTKTDGIVDKIFVTREYVKKIASGELNKASTANATPAYIQLANLYGGVAGNATRTELIGTGTYQLINDAGFVKNDVIVYTVTAKTPVTAKSGLANVRIMDAAKAESFTGKVTAVAANNGSFTVDGTAYAVNPTFYPLDNIAVAVGNSYTFYLDSYGNIIGSEQTESAAATQYVYITSYQVSKDSLLSGGYRAVAKATFTDGTVKIIDLKVTDTNHITKPLNDGTVGDGEIGNGSETATVAINKWFGYTESDGKYVLSALKHDYAFQGNGSFAAGDLAGVYRIVGDSAASYYTTKDTKYVRIDADGNVDTKTGFDSKASFNTHGSLLYTISKDAGTVTGIYEANATSLTGSSTASYAYVVKCDSTVENGAIWIFAVNGEQVPYTLRDATASTFDGGPNRVYTITEDASHAGFYKWSAVTTFQGIVASGSGRSVRIYGTNESDTDAKTYTLADDCKIYSVDSIGTDALESAAVGTVELEELSAENKILFVIENNTLSTSNEILAVWVIDVDINP